MSTRTIFDPNLLMRRISEMDLTDKAKAAMEAAHRTFLWQLTTWTHPKLVRSVGEGVAQELVDMLDRLGLILKSVPVDLEELGVSLLGRLALRHFGIITMPQLQGHTEAELVDKGVDNGTINEVKKRLDFFGLTLKEQS